MTVQTQQSELQAFCEFTQRALLNGGADLSPEECLADYRAWRAEIEWLKRELQPALERADRGEGRVIDREEFMQTASERLRKEGIPETDAATCRGYSKNCDLMDSLPLTRISHRP